MISITHIINPVKVESNSDLFIAQPVTFQTMLNAKKFAKEVVKVNLVATQYSEDRSIIPDYFNKTKDLERSVLDFGSFEKKRKLPLLKDILEKAVEFDTSADYIIYTNVDIGLYPHFYSSILGYIQQGYDGICVNRNTLLNENIKSLALFDLYSIKGEDHEGIDCFVIKKDLVLKMILENSIIGTGPVGLIIANNLICFCEKFIWLRKSNLTFHIGDDKSWLKEKIKNNSLLIYSFFEFKKILNMLRDHTDEVNKLSIIDTSLDFVTYFIENKNFKTSLTVRSKIALYSDRKSEKIEDLNKISQKNKKTKVTLSKIKSFFKI